MRKSIYPIFLHIALIALAIAAVHLVRVNRDLAAQLNPAEPQLEIGASVTSVDIESLAGEPDSLQWGDSNPNRLLLVFTTSCPACAENQDAWRSLHQTLPHGVEIVGISLDDAELTRTYREAHDLPFDVVVAADREAFLTSYEIYSVPSTLHISQDGRVQGVWRGVLSDDRRSEIESSLVAAGA